MRSLAFLCILIAAALGLRGDPAEKNWSSDPEWVKERYGAWGGPGVNPAPGPMDRIALRDYAPKPSLIVTEHSASKAKYPVIDVHAHVNAKTPEEVRAWVPLWNGLTRRKGPAFSEALGYTGSPDCATLASAAEAGSRKAGVPACMGLRADAWTHRFKDDQCRAIQQHT